jgi:hypothetical protein
MIIITLRIIYMRCYNFLHPQPGSAASQSANKKRKAEVAKKHTAKKAKAGMS